MYDVAVPTVDVPIVTGSIEKEPARASNDTARTVELNVGLKKTRLFFTSHQEKPTESNLNSQLLIWRSKETRWRFLNRMVMLALAVVVPTMRIFVFGEGYDLFPTTFVCLMK